MDNEPISWEGSDSNDPIEITSIEVISTTAVTSVGGPDGGRIYPVSTINITINDYGDIIASNLNMDEFEKRIALLYLGNRVFTISRNFYYAGIIISLIFGISAAVTIKKK